MTAGTCLSIKCTTQVWTVVAGQTFSTTSGRPLSPSQTRKNTSRVPRFRISVSTDIEEFGAFTAGPGPQSEHVAVTVETDADRGINRPVRDLPVPDLDDDRVDENCRVHLVERPGSPVLHFLEYFVGDPRDGFLRDRGAWGSLPLAGEDFSEMRTDLTSR